MKNRCKGFTLAEMLIVLAVLSLILCIIAPFVSNYIVAMRKNSLDFYAKEVYKRSLNRLVSGCSFNPRKLTREADFCDENRYYYILSAEDFIVDVFFDYLDDPLGGAAIVAVTKGYTTVAEAYFSVEYDVGTLLNMIMTSDSGELKGNPSVGFYGIAEEFVILDDMSPAPLIEVVNENELYLDISFRIPDDADIGDYYIGLKLFCGEYEISEEVRDLTLDGNTLHGRYTVDKLYSNGDSLFINNHPSFFNIPDSITAKAIVYEAGNASDEGFAEFSPLFASKSCSSIEISCLRHLNNLRYVESSADTLVRQTADIDFEDLLVDGFSPISDFCGTFDGGFNSMIYPTLRCENNNAGIFGNLSGKLENICVVGGSSTLAGEINGSANIGILCGTAKETSTIINCAVSGADITINADGYHINAGAIAGASAGSIINCDSRCNISISEAETANLGGISGLLDGGSIKGCRSRGRLVLLNGGDGSRVCGISGGSGPVKSCWSECSAGYISGAEYWGIGSEDIICESSYFLDENAWLAEKRSCAVDSDRYSVEKLAQPRGLVGIVQADYIDGEYVTTVLTCFDAYGNRSKRCPTIRWDNPRDGERRYYLYNSKSVFPGKGETGGWSCTFCGCAELGEENSADGFAYCQIIISDETVDAVLRFDEVCETVVLEGLPEEVSDLSKLGIIAVISTTEYDYDFNPLDVCHYCYTYYDFADSSNHLVPELAFANEDEYLGAISDFTFTRADEWEDEVRIFVFADNDSEALFGSGFMLSSADFAPPFEVSGLNYHEYIAGWSFGERFTVTVDLADGGSLSASLIIDMDWWGYADIQIDCITKS